MAVARLLSREATLPTLDNMCLQLKELVRESTEDENTPGTYSHKDL